MPSSHSSSEHSDANVSDSESISSEELALAQSSKQQEKPSQPRIFVPLLRQKLADFALNLPFSATLAVSAPRLVSSDASLEVEDGLTGNPFENLHLENDAIKQLLPPSSSSAAAKNRSRKNLSSSVKNLESVSLAPTQVHDDLARETAIYKSVLNSVAIALPELKAIGVATTRPSDYYAEMLKTDAHMLRIKERILGEKKSIDEAEHRRQVREGKKFGKEVQKQREQEKRESRKRNMQSAQEWRKIGKDDRSLDRLMKNQDHDDADYASFSTTQFGGQNRKRNSSASKQQGMKRGRPSASSAPKQRPGKRARAMSRGRSK